MKFLNIINGIIQQVTAIVTSSGAGDANKIIATNSSGKLDATFLPAGIGDDLKQMTAFETLAAGDYINIFDDAGTAKVRKASASVAGKEANGFVLSAASIDAAVDVYFEGLNDQLTGLTPGAIYYLSATTAGGVVSTAPSGSGNAVQKLGRAVSATEIAFEPTQPVVLA